MFKTAGGKHKMEKNKSSSLKILEDKFQSSDNLMGSVCNSNMDVTDLRMVSSKCRENKCKPNFL